MKCARRSCGHEVAGHAIDDKEQPARPPVRVGEANHCTKCSCKGFCLSDEILAHQQRELDRVGRTPKERAEKHEEQRKLAAAIRATARTTPPGVPAPGTRVIHRAAPELGVGIVHAIDEPGLYEDDEARAALIAEGRVHVEWEKAGKSGAYSAWVLADEKNPDAPIMNSATEATAAPAEEAPPS